MKTTKPIQVFDAASMKAIVDMVRWWKRSGAALDTSTRTQERGPYDDADAVFNASGYDCPLGGILWTAGMETDAVQLRGRRPQYPGITRLRIAAAPIAAGEPGRGYGIGQTPRVVRVANWSTLAVGDRIGARKDSFAAEADPLGPMTIVAKTTAPEVLAVCHGRRGDCFYVRTRDRLVKGPFYVVLCEDSLPLRGRGAGVCVLGLPLSGTPTSSTSTPVGTAT